MTPELARATAEVNAELRGSVYDYYRANADLIASILRPLCVQVEVVGSIRRGEPQPNDIDILVQPKYESTLADHVPEGVVIKECERLSDTGTTERKGSHVVSFQFEGIPCDVIFVRRAHWGLSLLQFTGSRAFDRQVFANAKARGYKVKNGEIGRWTKEYHSTWVSCTTGKTETEILVDLNLHSFIDPATRNWLEPDLQELPWRVRFMLHIRWSYVILGLIVLLAVVIWTAIFMPVN